MNLYDIINKKVCSFKLKYNIIEYYNPKNELKEVKISCFDYLLFELYKYKENQNDNYFINLYGCFNNLINCTNLNLDEVNEKSIELLTNKELYNVLEILIDNNKDFIHHKLCLYLLAYSIKINKKNINIIKLLLLKINNEYLIDNIENKFFFEILNYPNDEKNKKELIDILINKGINLNSKYNNCYLLIESIKIQNDVITKLLIERGLKINIKDKLQQKNLLMYAIEYNNNIEIIELLLRKRIDINDKDMKSNTSLHYACKYRSIDVLNILLNEKIKVNEKNSEGLTPLMVSIIENNWICTLRLLNLHDIDVNTTDKNNKTALYYMINNSVHQNKIYNQLFERGAYFDYNDIIKKSFFKKIVENDELVLSFKEKGILIYNNEKKFIKKYNSLIFAINVNDMKLLENLLIFGADPNEKDDNHETPLVSALKNNNLDAIKILVKYKVNFSNEKQNILHLASNCQKEILSFMLELEDTNKSNVYYHSNESLLIFDACNNEDIKGLEKIINNNDITYKINEKDGNGMTPLLFSLQNKKYKSVEYLLNNCDYLDVNITDKNGETAIDYIIKQNIQNIYDIFYKLVDRGGYIDFQYFNKSSIDLIVNNTDIIKYFINVGIPIKDNKMDRRFIIPNPLIFAVKQDNYLFTKILLENNALIDEVDSDHKTPLIYAIDNNNKYLIDLLLKNHADINKVIDEKGMSPIIYTIQRKNLSLFNYLTLNVSDEFERNRIIKSIICFSLNNKDFEMIDFIKDNLKYNTVLISKIINELLKNNKIDVESENEDGNSLLHYSCLKGNDYIIKELFNSDQDFNIKNGIGRTPLIITIINKKYDSAKFLLKENPLIDVNCEDKFGETTMSYLLKNFDYDEDLIELIYEKGFYFNIDNFKNDKLLKYIIRCVDLLKLFIDVGIRIKNSKNEIELIKTPLIFAVKNNIKNLLISLLNLKANVNEIDDKSRTPLYYAIVNNNIDILNILLNFNADINQEIMDGKTALIYIIENKKVNLFMKLIQNKNIKDNFNKVIESIYSYSFNLKNYDIITFMVDQLEVQYDIYNPLLCLLNSNKFNINEIYNTKGWDLLHYACYVGNEKLVKILLYENYDYDINKKCDDGSTPLMLSVKNGKFECASKLIEYNPDVNIEDNTGDTPLTYMLKHNNLYNEYILDKLIKSGGYLPIKFIKDDNYLKFVTSNKALMKTITYNGIKIKDEKSDIIYINQPLLYAVKNNNIFLVSELIKNGSKINEVDNNNNNSLVYAIKNKNYEIIKLLLTHNIELNYLELDEKNPLIFTIDQNDPTMFQCIINNINGVDKIQKLNEIVNNIILYAEKKNNFSIIKFIHKILNRNIYSMYDKLNNIVIKKDKNYNVKEYKSIQPLHYACMEGNEIDIEKLITQGEFDINQRNNDGSTPLMVAIKNENYSCVKLLFDLSNNIDVNISDYNGMTSFTYMLDHKVERMDIYILLLENNACIPIEFIKANSSINILLQSEKTNQYIIKNGLKINDNGNIKQVTNMINFAIDIKQEEILELLLDKKDNYDIEKNINDDKNPLQYAIEKNNEEAFNILMKKVSQTTIDSIIKYIILKAFKTQNCSLLCDLKKYIWSNDNSIINIINDANKNINQYKKNGYKPLHEAVRKNDIELICDLLKYEYDINMKDEITKETALIVAIKNRKYEIIKILLNYDNINVNVSFNDQQSPIIFMINDKMFENVEVFNELIVHNANITETFKGDTPLMLSIKNKRINYVKVLLNQPTLDINQSNKQGKTVLSLMIEQKIDNQEAFNLLFEKGSFLESQYINSNKLIKLIETNKGLLKSMAQNGFNVKRKNIVIHIDKPVIYFIKASKNTLVDKLLQNGASVEKTDEDGLTPIFHCVRSNNTKAFFSLINNYKADITKRSKNGQTLLNYATNKNKNDVIISELKKLNNKINNPLSNIPKGQMNVKEKDELIKTNSTNLKKKRRGKEEKKDKLVKEKPQSKIKLKDTKYDINSYLNSGKMINTDTILKSNRSLLLMDEESNSDDNYSCSITDDINIENEEDDDYISDELFDNIIKSHDNNKYNKNKNRKNDNSLESTIYDERDFDFICNNEKVEDQPIKDEDINKYPELHYACLNENVDFIDMYINEFQYDINETCNDGSTALLLSIKKEKIKSVKVLLKNKASIIKPDNTGETPISYVLKHSSNKNNEILQLLLPNLKMNKTYPPENLTPFNYLIKYNNLKGVLVISKLKGFNIDEIDHNGDTPLIHAIKNNSNNEKLIEILLMCGANSNQLSKENKVPLIYAIEKKSISIANLLIKYKANIDFELQNGLTPLKLAIKSNDINIARALLAAKKRK